MAEKDMYAFWMKTAPKRVMMLGAILFLIGLLRNLGYDWNIVLMAVGALLFLKGLVLKLKK
ncbi:MAG: hypothetical protein HYW24_00020 [Candidatus Aenigmarchaeota archaeon]|nr:hypothetical protein [Candidatus Aenigmarchaeota archaeon]